MSPADILTEIRNQLAQEHILDFGTAVYKQIDFVGSDGRVAMPAMKEQSISGHSMCIIGYNDDFVNLDGSKRAFEIRNSWATSWGDSGYGWMPYGYLLQGVHSQMV